MRKLTKPQMRAIFKRNYGAANQLALKLGVSRVAISKALRGGFEGKRIDAAIRERAEELLVEEQANGQAA
jgi:hypothetical protein